MGAAIGEVLPFALGIAVSPVPIIITILILLSPKAKATGLGYLLGWLLGIVVAVVVFNQLASMLPQADADQSQPLIGMIEIIFGVLLLFLAARQWRARPTGNTELPLPKWMASIDTMSAVRALALGFILSGLNPKNLLLGIAAGVAIGAEDLTVEESVVTIAVFTVFAASTVATPVLAYLAASAKVAAPLEVLRKWLVHNNATVMAVLLLVIGVVTIGNGIGSY